ncbi:MAG TPA: alginate export family protein, partial [Rariglobus sp.]
AVKAGAPASFTDALTQGKVSINARLRYESVEQDSQQDADALTARLRLGYATKVFKGFQAMIEGEAVTPIIDDYFDGTGTNSAPPTATVADPEVYNVNQAWVSYSREKTKGTLGRQRLVLDNARFVGDVGWRQNDQTFDALVLQDKTFEKLTLTYGYVSYVNRVFDNETGPTAASTQLNWRSDSHILNASYAGLPFGTLTGYAYLLDFDAHGLGQAAARANSTQTYGLSLAGTRPVAKDLKASYRLEYALQSDYAGNPFPGGYSADYYAAEVGAAYQAFSLAAGYEVLGSDDGLTGFKTPLATLHAFNGWADVFLNTPSAGLTDTYVKAGATLPGNTTLTAFYHFFGTEDAQSQIGREFDVVATYKLNKQLSFTAKVAKYWSDQTAVAGVASNADRTKFWLQADYAY